MTDAQRVLLEHLASALFKIPAKAGITAEVIREAADHAVLTLLPIEDSPFYWKSVAHNVIVTLQHQQLHQLMTEHGVPYAILKGVASASYYPEPDRRQMGDVDFLIRSEDIEQVRRLLEDKGFTGSTERHAHHVEYHKPGSIWELHWRPPGFPEALNTDSLTDEMISTAVNRDSCMCVSDYHHGLILLTHSAQHMLGSGIGLRHACDWAVFYASLSEEAFCTQFESALKELGLWRFAQLLTQLCICYLGAPDRSWAHIGDDALMEAMITDILDGGNFGRKEEGRHLQASLITDRRGMTVGNKKSGLRRFTETVLDYAYAAWPVCEKHKLLVPIGVIAAGIKGMKLLSKKSSSFSIRKAITAAEKRKAIYQEFALFDTENQD